MNVSVPTAATGGFPAGAAGGVARGHHGHGGNQKLLQAVAQTLGTSTDDLTQQLASGKSLTDIASAAGVSKDDLVSTIASALPSTAPDGSTIDTTAMATRIADSTRRAAPPAPPNGSGAAGASADLGTGIQALAGALGVSSGDLLQRLTDGTGIADLLSANPDVSTQLTALMNRGAMVDGYA